MPLNTWNLIREVRRAIDEVTLSGERVITDADLQDLASSNFSDLDIYDRLQDGARYVAARVRASQLQGLVQTIHPKDIVSTTDGGNYDPADDGTWPSFLRLLESRVALNGIPANRRTFSGHIKLSDRGLKPSDSYPVFVFEDFELHVYGDTVDPVGASADVIMVPVDVEFDATVAAATTDSINVTISPESAFSSYSSMYAGGKLIGNTGQFFAVAFDAATNTVTLDRVASFGMGEAVKLIVPAVHFLPDRLGRAVLMYATATCFHTLNNGAGLTMARRAMLAEIKPYMLKYYVPEKQEQEG